MDGRDAPAVKLAMHIAFTDRTGAPETTRLPGVAPMLPPEPAVPAPSAASPSYGDLQRLVDLAANFHLRTVPVSATAAPTSPVSFLRLEQTVHRMCIEQCPPAAGSLRSSGAS